MKKIKNNRTKVIATIGPSSSGYDVLKDLVLNGVDVVRLNFSHGDFNDRKKTIKNIQKIREELNVPVIALSQLSRAVETRSGTKRPILSDLRESGAIEQDADIVSFIYRPEYYGMENWDDDMQTPSQGQGELIIAKHRNGALGNVRLKFIAELGKFEDIDGYDSPFEFQSKLNTDNKLSDFSEPSNKDDDEDIPF